MNPELVRKARLAVRWVLWCIPLALLGSTLTVLLVSVLAVGFRDVLRQLASFTDPGQLVNLAVAAIGLVAYWAAAIAIWVVLTHLLPKLDSLRWSLVVCFPATVVGLFIAISLVTTRDGPKFTWLALVAPTFLGLLAVSPRLVDPALLHGSFSSSQASTRAAG